MSYEAPSLTIQQEFQALPPEVRSDQIACIIGPSRKISSPAVSPSSEIKYGEFDPAADMEFSLRGLPAGEAVDAGSVSVILNEVLAEYANITTNNIVWVGDTPNAIEIGSAAGANEAFTAGNGAVRLSGLGGRDVRVGDRVQITHAGGELLTRIVRLSDRMSVSSLSDSGSAAVFNSASNPATAGSASFTPSILTSGVSGRVGSDLVDGGGYIGDLTKGVVAETYTLTVLVGGTYSVASVGWSSSNGDDSGSGTVGANSTAPMTIGIRGASVEFPQLATRALVAGEVFRIVVGAVFTRAVATTSGTYSGAVDTAYVITVIKGGLWAASPKVSVTSNNGADVSSVQTLSSLSRVVVLGNKGPSITLDISAGGLRLGDTFVVTASASVSIGKKVARLAQALPVLDGATVINEAGDSLDIKFLSRQLKVEVPPVSYPEFNDESWSHGARILTLSSSTRVLDPTVVDSTGDMIPLTVFSANVEIHYTATLKSGSLVTRTVSSISAIEGVLGPVVPGNELAFAARCALLNSGGVHVLTIQTAGHSVSDYERALRIAERLEDIYIIVPTSSNKSVIDSVTAHVNSMSHGRKGLERICVTNMAVPTTRNLFVDVDDDTKWSGYVSADGLGGFTRLSMPGATFLDAGVRNGDIIRAGFSVSPDGADTFGIYQVLEVIDQENATLLFGPSGPIGTSAVLSRIEMVRINTPLEVCEAARDNAEAIGNRRVYNVFPDVVMTSGLETVPGFNLAAAVAGLASSVVAHQPISEVELRGFSDIPFLLEFSLDELDIAAGGGNFIVMQDAPGSRIYVRHQISTDNGGILVSEMSITRGSDMIARYLRTAIKPLLGGYNITPEYLQMIETLAQQRLDAMMRSLYNLKAGPPILSNDRIRATQDPSISTGFIVDIPIVHPKPANKGTIRLYIS